MIYEYKICVSCGEEKEIKEFWSMSKTKRKRYLKICHNCYKKQRQKKYNLKHRTHINELSKFKQRKLRKNLDLCYIKGIIFRDIKCDIPVELLLLKRAELLLKRELKGKK